MKSTIGRAAQAALGAAVFGLIGLTPAFADTVKITLMGIGDIYQFTDGKVRGGPARLNAVAKAEKAANPNFFYALDGDMISPSLLSGLDKGANMIGLTNVVPFDVAVPGNHEFDFGPEAFKQRVAESKYPWDAVGLTGADGKPVPWIGGAFIKEMAGVKLGIVPVALDQTADLSSPGDIKIPDTIKTAEDTADALRKQGADIVVLVVHADHGQDQQLMQSHKFDVILSGHDHDLWTAYDGQTVYVETSTEANYLVPVDLDVTVTDKDGKRSVSWEPEFRFIDTATVTPDPETEKLVDQLKTKLSGQLDVDIGKTTEPLDSRVKMVRSQETAIGDIIADAMRAANGADVAITNGGGIRGNKQYPADTTLTRRDVFTELPFGNVTVVTELKGKAIRDALENGFSQVETTAGRFPQVSGMKVVADLSQPPGQRVVSVMVGDKPLDPDAMYKVATNDYMLGGGDGYTALGTGKVLINASAGNLMATDVMNYIEATKTIDQKVEGRITEK
jgi:2',3'-cyclic-nucleotide 2'-phosphodiesterase (5'-nucleotidase family)